MQAIGPTVAVNDVGAVNEVSVPKVPVADVVKTSGNVLAATVRNRAVVPLICTAR